jgi:hypothetical protein
MIHVRAAQEKNTSSAVAQTSNFSFNKERVRRVIELDQYRFVLNEYQSPLNEVRDSL